MKLVCKILFWAFIVTAFWLLAVDVPDREGGFVNEMSVRSQTMHDQFEGLDDFIEKPLTNWFGGLHWLTRLLTIALSLVVLFLLFFLLMGMFMYQSGGLQRMKNEAKVGEHFDNNLLTWVLFKLLTK